MTPGYELKLGRASHHLQKLDDEVGRWIEANTYRTIHKFSPRAGKYVISVNVQDLARAKLAVLIGDCLHNLRSSLDHLAYSLALVCTGDPLPQKIAEDSEFTIFGDEDRKGRPGSGPKLFQSNAHKLAGIDPRAKAIIEGLQPYQRGSAFRTDPLWILYELARLDRHRLPHLAILSSRGGSIRVGAETRSARSGRRAPGL